MEWDSIDQLRINDELGTITIEFLTILAALSVIIIIIYLKMHYPKLTRKGFNEMILGFGVFSAHFIFDLLDTWVTKKNIDDETTLAYIIFDYLDAIFAFIGLFIIGYAFYRIAIYGIKIWEGK